jgi:glycosyltransferase involved in cell wall biosynthesis
VKHGETGYLVEEREPAAFAEPVARLLRDRELNDRFRRGAAMNARRYTWSTTSARLRRIYADLTARSLVRCS